MEEIQIWVIVFYDVRRKYGCRKFEYPEGGKVKLGLLSDSGVRKG